jgi:hypothetical protein
MRAQRTTRPRRSCGAAAAPAAAPRRRLLTWQDKEGEGAGESEAGAVQLTRSAAQQCHSGVQSAAEQPFPSNSPAAPSPANAVSPAAEPPPLSTSFFSLRSTRVPAAPGLRPTPVQTDSHAICAPRVRLAAMRLEPKGVLPSPCRRGRPRPLRSADTPLALRAVFQGKRSLTSCLARPCRQGPRRPLRSAAPRCRARTGAGSTAPGACAAAPPRPRPRSARARLRHGPCP